MSKEIQPIYNRCQAIETLEGVLMHCLDHSDWYIPPILNGYKSIQLTIRIDCEGLPTIETKWEEVDAESYLKSHRSKDDDENER